MTEEKDRRLKIFWSSNAPWTTSGYGVQTGELLSRFVKDGWQVACSCFYGLEGAEINYQGIHCYPKMAAMYGDDACVYHAQDYGANVTFTFQNIWPMDPQFFPRMKNWIPYIPVEHYPLEQASYERLKMAYRILSFSKFGQKAIEEAGLFSTLIEEAVDTDIFKPMDKIESRKQLGIPEDVFLFGMVAANKDNPPRKSFQHTLDALKRLKDNHPEKRIGIFFQTLLQQQGGFPIHEYARHLKIEQDIWFPPPYQMMYKSPHPVVARIMNTFDCLINASTGEGFGLPIVEAQSCGVPVIVNDWTSMPELVVEGKTGLICKHGFERWAPIGGYAAEPDLDSLYDCMERMYASGREKMSDACREHILKNYDMDTRVREQWIPFLEEIQKDILK